MFLKKCTGYFITVLLFSFVINNTFAQSQRSLTLDDAIDIALGKSYQIKTLQLNLARAEDNLIAAKGRFRTNANMNFNIPSWRETVNEIPVQDALPVFNTTGSIFYQNILRINQPLPTDGVFTLMSNIYHRDVSTFLNSENKSIKRKEIYSSIRLQFSQPLFTVNKLKMGYKYANLNFEGTKKQFKRSELNLVYDVTQSFFNLYRITRQKQIAEDDVKQQAEQYILAEQKYDAGLIPEVELLQMEVDLAESKNKLVTAKGDLLRADNSFKQLIGLEFSENIILKTELKLKKFDVNLEKAIVLALKNRCEVREREIDVELAKLNIKEVDSRTEIRGELNSFYDLTGVSDPYLPYSSSFSKLWTSSVNDMQRRPNNRGVTFTLSVPLWDWGVNKAEVAAAKAELRNRELELIDQKKTIIREVQEVVGKLKEAENRLDVLYKNKEIAQQMFNLQLERFNIGDITSQELALDRVRLIQSRSSYLAAYIDYKLSVADIKRKTMWDFEKDRSLVE